MNKNKIKLSITLLLTAFSNIFATWQPICPGIRFDEFAPYAQKFVYENRITPDWVKYNFEIMAQANNNIRSEEQKIRIKEDLRKLMDISEFLIENEERKQKTGGFEEKYWNLFELNQKIIAIILDKPQQEIDRIEREYAEKREERRQAEETMRQIKEQSRQQDLDNERFLDRMKQVSAESAENTQVGRGVMSFLSRMLPALGDDPSRQSSSAMAIDDGSAVRIEELPDDEAAAGGRRDPRRSPRQAQQGSWSIWW